MLTELLNRLSAVLGFDRDEKKEPDFTESVDYQRVMNYLREASFSGVSSFKVHWQKSECGRYKTSYKHDQIFTVLKGEFAPTDSELLGRKFRGEHFVYYGVGTNTHRFEMQAIPVEVSPQIEGKPSCIAVLSYEVRK